MKNEFMKRAIELSIESVNKGGGPFGCVIIKDAIASIGDYKITPIINAPATPEKILMSIKNLERYL